jgi:hypothetical protein
MTKLKHLTGLCACAAALLACATPTVPTATTVAASHSPQASLQPDNEPQPGEFALILPGSVLRDGWHASAQQVRTSDEQAPWLVRVVDAVGTRTWVEPTPSGHACRPVHMALRGVGVTLMTNRASLVRVTTRELVFRSGDVDVSLLPGVPIESRSEDSSVLRTGSLRVTLANSAVQVGYSYPSIEEWQAIPPPPGRLEGLPQDLDVGARVVLDTPNDIGFVRGETPDPHAASEPATARTGCATLVFEVEPLPYGYGGSLGDRITRRPQIRMPAAHIRANARLYWPDGRRAGVSLTPIVGTRSNPRGVDLVCIFLDETVPPLEVCASDADVEGLSGGVNPYGPRMQR